MKTTARRTALLAAAGLLISCARPPEPVPEGPRAQIDEALHDFGEVPQGTPVAHTFRIRNIGTEELVVRSVDASEMVQVRAFDEVVPPGGEGRIEVALETSGRTGSGELAIRIVTNDPHDPERSVWLRGRLVPLIEINRQNRLYFFDVLRGETPEQELTIVNHQDVPLQVLEIEQDEDSAFETRLQAVEEGQSYTLTVQLRDSRRAEHRIDEQLTLVSDSPTLPRIPIHLLATLENPVDTRPKQVFWSTFQRDDPDQSLREKRVRVAKRGGTDFQVLDVSTDLEFIDLEVVPEAAGQSHTVHLRLDVAKAPNGAFEGELRVRTSDPDFAELTVPISGRIL